MLTPATDGMHRKPLVLLALQRCKDVAGQVGQGVSAELYTGLCGYEPESVLMIIGAFGLLFKADKSTRCMLGLLGVMWGTCFAGQ